MSDCTISYFTSVIIINQIANHKLLNLSKLKTIAGGKSIAFQTIEFGSERQDNITGKGKNAGY